MPQKGKGKKMKDKIQGRDVIRKKKKKKDNGNITIVVF